MKYHLSAVFLAGSASVISIAFNVSRYMQAVKSAVLVEKCCAIGMPVLHARWNVQV